MSINAYRMKRNSSKFESPSFDIWHDARFIEFLDEQIQFYMSLNSYGTGIVDIPLELIEKVAGSASEFALDDDTVSQGSLSF